MGILPVELDGVHARKWNADRLITFKSVILQCVQGVNNSAKVRKRILFRLYWWNRWAFDKLVKDTYNSDMGYLQKSRGNQTKEQRHRLLSNLVLKVKFREAVQFVFEIEKGGVFSTRRIG